MGPYFEQDGVRLHHGDCLDVMREIPDGNLDAVITSPPYNLGKIYEKRSELREYLALHRRWIAEAARVVRHGGALCWQLGHYVRDDLVVPLDLALYQAFLDDGLVLRNRIVWTFGHGLHCTRRLSGRHETVLWFTKGNGHTFNLDAIRVPQKYPGKRHYKGPNKGNLSCNPLGKNPGDVWEITNVKHNHPEKLNHPCQFPEELARRLVLMTTKPGDAVLDPFCGVGTTGVPCIEHGRDFHGIERKREYCEIAARRLSQMVLPLAAD
jgi:adenine-specific DNA-methyltransferase